MLLRSSSPCSNASAYSRAQTKRQELPIPIRKALDLQTVSPFMSTIKEFRGTVPLFLPEVFFRGRIEGIVGIELQEIERASNRFVLEAAGVQRVKACPPLFEWVQT